MISTRGLANSSDVVGRHYMGHTNSVLMAISKCPNPTIFQKTLGVNDFYFGAEDFKYPMGTSRLSANWTRSLSRPAHLPLRRVSPLELMAKHSLDFWLTSEDLPILTIASPSSQRERSFLPTARITRKATKGFRGSSKHEADELHDARSRLSSGTVRSNLYVGQHSPGRRSPPEWDHSFGRDPKTSVLDSDCKAHDVDNLYVVDGSFFPSSAAVNPALTIMANAIRVGDHLMKRLGVSQTEYNGIDSRARNSR